MFSTSLATVHLHFVFELSFLHFCRIAWQAYLPIVVKVFQLVFYQVIVSGFLDTTLQLYESTYCLWCVWLNRTYDFVTSRSHLPIRPASE